MQTKHGYELKKGNSINKQGGGGPLLGVGQGPGAQVLADFGPGMAGGGGMTANVSQSLHAKSLQSVAGQQPVQMIGNEYAKNAGAGGFMKNPYVQKQKVQANVRPPNRARTASKPRGTMAASGMGRAVGQAEPGAEQPTGKRNEKGSGAIGGIRIKVVDKKKSANGGARGGTGPRLEAKLGVDQPAFGENARGQMVQRPVTGPSAVGGGSSQSVGRAASGAPYSQGQFAMPNARTGYSQGKQSQRAGALVSSSLNQQFVGVPGHPTQQFMPPNAYNSQLQLPSHGLPPTTWQTGAWGASAASPAARSRQQVGAAAKAASKQGPMNAEVAESKKRMAPSKSYKNIRMYNNLLEDEQSAPLVRVEQRDGLVSKKEQPAPPRGGLAASQPVWPRAEATADLVNKFQARSRSSQGGRPAMAQRNGQNPLQDPVGGQFDSFQAALEKRDSRGRQQDRQHAPSQQDMSLPHPPPAARKSDFYSGKEGKDFLSASQNVASQHIPTIEKIYRAQPDGQAGRSQAHFQSHLPAQSLVGNAQIQQPSQNLKHRHVIPKIKKAASSKNQVNQFKQAQHHFLQNKMPRNQSSQGLNYLTADQSVNPDLAGGPLPHSAFDHTFSSANVAQMQHTPLLSQTIPVLHLLRSNNAKGNEVPSHLQQTYQQPPPDGGRNHRQQATTSGPEGVHPSQSVGPSSGMGSGLGAGKMHGQQPELAAPHSQGAKRRAENEQMLNYIKVKNKLTMQSQQQQQQPSRTNLTKMHKSQPTTSTVQQWQGQNAAGPSSKPQGNIHQALATNQNPAGTGQKQQVAKGIAQDFSGLDQHPKGMLMQTKSQDSLAKVQRVQRNELRPKSVKNRPPPLNNQTQQIQQEEAIASAAEKEKAEAEPRNDEVPPIASSQSNRPFQGQGAQMNHTPELHLQEPQKPTIPTKGVHKSHPALHISSSHVLEENQPAQSQNTQPVIGSNSAQKIPKQPGQPQHLPTAAQSGGQHSSGQKVLKSMALSSKPKDGRNQQIVQRKAGASAGPAANGQQQNHNLNSKDMVKRAAATSESDPQRKEATPESAQAASNIKRTNVVDQLQISSKGAADRGADQKRQENRSNRKSQDAGASRSKPINQDQADDKNIRMGRKGKDEKPEALASPGTGQHSSEDPTSISKSKMLGDGSQSSFLSLIRHPLKDYYSKLNEDLRGIDSYLRNQAGKPREELRQAHHGRQPLDPKQMEKDTNFGGGQSQKKAFQLQSKASSAEKYSKSSDYQYAFVSHGGWSADRQDELPNLTFSSSCQGVKEHPKSQSPSGGLQHSKCSFFVLFETIQPSDKKGKVDSAAQARQQNLLKRLSYSLQDKVFSNQSFLHNPTDALASGLTTIRKEALQEVASEGTQKAAILDSDQSKGADGRQDLIAVREQNLSGTSAISKEGKEAQSKPGLPSQLAVIVIIDDICLCANIGSCRAIMSSKGGGRLYCLNMEHTVPGNEIEEKRILAQMARHKKQAKTPQEHAFCRDALTEYIATINLPQTRMIGPVPPREHAQDVKKQKYDKMLDQLQQELIISDPDITAIQLTDQEEFIIIGSSGLFKRLQGQDLQNIVWQRALMLGLKQRQTGIKDAKIDPSELAESLIQMASIKKGQGNLAALVVLFPVFHNLLNKFLDLLQQAHGPGASQDDAVIDFGALRVLLKNPELLRSRNSGSTPQVAHVEHLVEVDEIELEPIPLNEEQDRSLGTDKAYEDTYRMLNADDQSVQDNIDEIIYSHSSFAGLLGQQGPTQRRPGFATGRGVYGGRGVAPNMLSSIPEESSIKEMDVNSSSIVTDQNQLGGINSSGKMDRDLQSLVVPQTHGPDDDYDGATGAGGGGSGTKKNHRRFGKNATKFLGSSHNSDSQIKTLEQAPGNLDDVRVQAPFAVDVLAASISPGSAPKSQLINIQFGNNTNSAGSDHATSKDGKLRLSNRHSKKNSRTNSKNHTIEENDYGQHDLLNTSSLSVTTPTVPDGSIQPPHARCKTAWSPKRSSPHKNEGSM